MSTSEWKHWMGEFLDGVEGELRSSAPTKAKVGLRTFRGRLNEGHIIRRRKQFEQELEAFLQSEPSLGRAATRYLRKKVPEVVEAAVAVLKKARSVLARGKSKKTHLRPRSLPK